MATLRTTGQESYVEHMEHAYLHDLPISHSACRRPVLASAGAVAGVEIRRHRFRTAIRARAVPGDEPRSDEGLASALPATTARAFWPPRAEAGRRGPRGTLRPSKGGWATLSEPSIAQPSSGSPRSIGRGGTCVSSTITPASVGPRRCGTSARQRPLRARRIAFRVKWDSRKHTVPAARKLSPQQMRSFRGRTTRLGVAQQL